MIVSFFKQLQDRMITILPLCCLCFALQKNEREALESWKILRLEKHRVEKSRSNGDFDKRCVNKLRREIKKFFIQGETRKVFMLFFLCRYYRFLNDKFSTVTTEKFPFLLFNGTAS